MDLIVIVGVIASAITAVAIALLLPHLRFKKDSPLPHYRKRWAIYSAIIAIGIALGVLWVKPTIGVVVAMVTISAIGAVFVVTDQVHHRVPNVPMVILYVIVTGGILFDAITTNSWNDLMWAGIGFVATGIWFVIMATLGMGMGDVKLFTIIGAALAYLAWPLALIWIMLGYLFGAIHGMTLLMRGADRKANMPLVPPFMLALALVTLTIPMDIVSLA